MIDRCLDVLKSIEIMTAEMPEQLLSGHPEGELKGYRSEAFNLIPHEEDLGVCHDITVAIARGPGVNKWGFKNVMRQVRTHLITCPRTQVVIVLTDTWDPYRFKESRADLIAHMKNGTKIIIGLISKDQSSDAITILREWLNFNEKVWVNYNYFVGNSWVRFAWDKPSKPGKTILWMAY